MNLAQIFGRTCPLLCFRSEGVSSLAWRGGEGEVRGGGSTDVSPPVAALLFLLLVPLCFESSLCQLLTSVSLIHCRTLARQAGSMPFAFSKDLFVAQDGAPMHFDLSRCEDAQELGEYVEVGVVPGWVEPCQTGTLIVLLATLLQGKAFLG